MDNRNDLVKSIKGWGVDAAGDVSPRVDFPDSTQERFIPEYGLKRQETNKEILHSNERPNMTAVFGTTLPPSGISGGLRRFAFRYSESNWMHWLSLLFADRINVVEGLADDLRKGRIPNIPKEKGWGARWKYERRKTVTKIACCTGVLLLAILYSKNRKSRSDLS